MSRDGVCKQQSRVGSFTPAVGSTMTNVAVLAGAVAAYGIPRSHIQDTSNLSPICVQIDSGHCEVVDLQRAYLNAGHSHESVLLWKNSALDSSRSTRLSVRLLNTGYRGVSVFPFKEIQYFEPQEYARSVRIHV